MPAGRALHYSGFGLRYAYLVEWPERGVVIVARRRRGGRAQENSNRGASALRASASPRDTLPMASAANRALTHPFRNLRPTARKLCAAVRAAEAQNLREGKT